MNSRDFEAATKLAVEQFIRSRVRRLPRRFAAVRVTGERGKSGCWQGYVSRSDGALHAWGPQVWAGSPDDVRL